jgi:prepilin-type N-terminal cleavage/methylation domain-containing protein
VKRNGFTLLEIAVVLVIVGILLAGGINLLATTSDTAKYKQTQHDMQQLSEALTTYFVQHGGILPCPDRDNNTQSLSFGIADYVSGDANTGGICSDYQGWLPHVTLGIGGAGDAWGERYKFVVSRAFTAMPDFASSNNLCRSDQTTPFSRQSAKSWRLSIYDVQNASSIVPSKPTTEALLGDWAAFVVISSGKNGRQTNAAIRANSTGAFQGCAGLSVREQYHCVATHPSTSQAFNLRSGIPLSDGHSIIFDDLLVWVGDMQLLSQLRKAGICSR